MIPLILFGLFCFVVFLPVCFIKELMRRSPYDHDVKKRILKRGRCLACARSEWWTGEKCKAHRSP
jgi:hypothetical protein